MLLIFSISASTINRTTIFMYHNLTYVIYNSISRPFFALERHFVGPQKSLIKNATYTQYSASQSQKYILADLNYYN
jgi:hypothetical protein